MSPKQKAWAELALWTFLGGVGGYLAPIFVGGTLPHANEWKSVALCALGAGIVAVRNRMMPKLGQENDMTTTELRAAGYQVVPPVTGSAVKS